ncbi:hypothetical protein ANO14919_063800 [Xylariales sp. No.14919]|nr:hypothetical protein ANO14919_063800 [Xylariales sp. No.14919]
MRVNEDLAVSTPKVLLVVPYDPHHVDRYHQWMQNEDLREATASDLLTLEEEYENQQSWRTAHDKLTFIVCQPAAASPTNTGSEDAPPAIYAGVDDAAPRMAGDVNLFLTPEAEGGLCGEIDIMIAAPEHRRRGLGEAAVRALLRFLAGHRDAVMREYARGASGAAADQRQRQPLRLTRLVAKINAENAGSIRLFENLGFRRDGEPNYFNEVCMVLLDFPPSAGASAETGPVGYREYFYDRSLLKR